MDGQRCSVRFRLKVTHCGISWCIAADHLIATTLSVVTPSVKDVIPSRIKEEPALRWRCAGASNGYDKRALLFSAFEKTPESGGLRPAWWRLGGPHNISTQMHRPRRDGLIKFRTENFSNDLRLREH
jgi:hypothetical protein